MAHRAAGAPLPQGTPPWRVVSVVRPLWRVVSVVSVVLSGSAAVWMVSVVLNGGAAVRMVSVDAVLATDEDARAQRAAARRRLRLQSRRCRLAYPRRSRCRSTANACPPFTVRRPPPTMRLVRCRGCDSPRILGCGRRLRGFTPSGARLRRNVRREIGAAPHGTWWGAGTPCARVR